MMYKEGKNEKKILRINEFDGLFNQIYILL